MSFFLGVKFHRNIELTIFSVLQEFNRLKTETFKLKVNNVLTSRKVNTVQVDVEQEMSAVGAEQWPLLHIPEFFACVLKLSSR